MKILFSTEKYPTPDLPFAAFVAELCRELTRQGHEITVISPQSITPWLRGKRKLSPRFLIEKVECGNEYRDIEIYSPYYISISNNSLFQKFSIWSRNNAVRRTARKLEKPDFCYAHFWTNGDSIANYARKNNIPLFIATGEDKIYIHHQMSKKRISYIKESTKGVICVSTKNLEESVNAGFADTNNCIVLPNAVDDKLFYQRNKKSSRQELGFNEDDFIVAFVGRFDDRKGVKRVSDAIKSIGDPQIKSIFIGGSEFGSSEQPNCEGILYKGRLPHEKIPIYLSASDVFVLPSLAEGCSNVIVEAMACGLPIISSDLPFNYDILDKNNSFLINPKDVKAIAYHINLLKNDKKLCARMGENALLSASSLTLSNRASKIIEYIKAKTSK